MKHHTLTVDLPFLPSEAVVGFYHYPRDPTTGCPEEVIINSVTANKKGYYHTLTEANLFELQKLCLDSLTNEDN